MEAKDYAEKTRGSFFAEDEVQKVWYVVTAFFSYQNKFCHVNGQICSCKTHKYASLTSWPETSN